MEQEQVLKILFIEDMPVDLELAKMKIQNSSIAFESYLAETEDEFLRGLYEFEPDIIVSDYILPEFDGMRALELTLTYDNTIPFIILTGSANEETIIDAMKAGADDHVLKDRIDRLPFAIKEAVKKRNALKERKQAMESLEFLSQTIEQSPYTTISTDMQGMITSWNKGAEKMYGYSAKEVMGQHISLVYHKEDHTVLQKDIIEPLIEKGRIHQQARLKRKDGSTFTGSLSLWTIRDREGQITGMAGNTIDITKEKQADEDLRIKNQAIDINVDGIGMLDLEGRVTYVNRSALKMWGYENEKEVIGRKVDDFWKDLDDQREVLKNIRENRHKTELIAKRKDGSIFPVWVSMTMIMSPENEPIAYMGSFVDLTERKKAEEQMLVARIAAEEANRCKNELLANMNHELRTPLSSVIGYSDVMINLENDNLSTEQKKHLHIINTAGYKLLNLINNMLDLAHIESDILNIKFSTFDPAKSIEKVIEGMTLPVKKKKIDVNVNIDENVTEITADMDKFREIVYNLVENAVKFTSDNGKITISAIRKNDDIEVSVEDAGIGIAESDMERIFDPFVQVDSSNTRRFNGAGLGLVLVREYLKMQNGTIWVESEPGRGSKFTFKIPVYPRGTGNDI